MSRLIEYSLARDVAARVYSGKCSVPAGWELDTSFNPDAVPDRTGAPGELHQGSGFYAYALRPTIDGAGEAQNVRIFAIRGTERKKASDLYADVSDIGKSQFAGASWVINRWLAANLVAGRNIELIGHSLGGALVQWAVNDTNLSSEANAASVLSMARNLADPNVPGSTRNPEFGIKSSQLHFYTFNAPGITLSPRAVALSDKTSVVNGEHHVIALNLSFAAPVVKGDAVHLLGGAPVGGGVVAHRVNFAAVGHSGWFAHAINRPTWWDQPIDPGYVPPFPADFQVAQAVGRFVTDLFDAGGQWDSELAASVKLVIFFAAAATVGLPVQLGKKLRVFSGERVSTVGQAIRNFGQGASDFLSWVATAFGNPLKGTAKSVERVQTAGQTIVLTAEGPAADPSDGAGQSAPDTHAAAGVEFVAGDDLVMDGPTNIALTGAGEVVLSQRDTDEGRLAVGLGAVQLSVRVDDDALEGRPRGDIVWVDVRDEVAFAESKAAYATILPDDPRAPCAASFAPGRRGRSSDFVTPCQGMH